MIVYKKCDKCGGSGFDDFQPNSMNYQCSACDKGYTETEIPFEQMLQALKEARQELRDNFLGVQYNRIDSAIKVAEERRDE